MLSSASGVRLVVARAFSRAGYVVCPAGDVTRSETDARGLVWHTVRTGIDEIARAGVYRREMGRLVRDPFPMPYGAPKPDDVVAHDLRGALSDDALTSDAEVDVYVRHGVALLEGWIGTVGGKVIAERIARTTPGVWDAINRLTSDDELVGAVRAHVRRAGSVADAIQDLKVVRGTVRITLLPGSTGPTAELENAALEVPGVRSVELTR